MFRFLDLGVRRGALPAYSVRARALPSSGTDLLTTRAMSQTYTYKWPRPGLTVDAVIVSQASPPAVLLIKRKNDPYAGSWAIPGGFVDEGESLDVAAARELKEETGLSMDSVVLSQIAAFGDPGRDPRGWTVSVAYGALVPRTPDVQGADDAAEAKWWPLGALPPRLAFDHGLILKAAFGHLAGLPQTPALVAEALQQSVVDLERRS